MTKGGTTDEDDQLVDTLMAAYDQHRRQIGLFRDQLVPAIMTADKLIPHIHSVRSRLKDPGHLRDKLHRKLRAARAEGLSVDLSPETLLVRINDLVGIRILHLHTRQIQHIDPVLREIFDEGKYELIEGPFARTWDDESREFFRACNIQTQPSASMYTSVHYVIGSASRTKVTAEVQVRTLMEEVWGEVDHSINYPIRTTSIPCREQLKVLARVTSSATRLVDSIFATADDHKSRPAE